MSVPAIGTNDTATPHPLRLMAAGFTVYLVVSVVGGAVAGGLVAASILGVSSVSRPVEGKPVEIRFIGDGLSFVDGVPVALPAPNCERFEFDHRWRIVQTEAGYLLSVSIPKGVMEPAGGAWGYFRQVPLPSLEGLEEWGNWMYPLENDALGAVWVSPADLRSAYGIDVDRADIRASWRLMEATGNYLRPAWRVTCHWEGPAREVAGAS